MKYISVSFENNKFVELSDKKGNLSWREFIERLADKTEGFTIAEKPKGAKK